MMEIGNQIEFKDITNGEWKAGTIWKLQGDNAVVVHRMGNSIMSRTVSLDNVRPAPPDPPSYDPWTEVPEEHEVMVRNANQDDGPETWQPGDLVDDFYWLEGHRPRYTVLPSPPNRPGSITVKRHDGGLMKTMPYHLVPRSWRKVQDVPDVPDSPSGLSEDSPEQIEGLVMNAASEFQVGDRVFVNRAMFNRRQPNGWDAWSGPGVIKGINGATVNVLLDSNQHWKPEYGNRSNLLETQVGKLELIGRDAPDVVPEGWKVVDRSDTPEQIEEMVRAASWSKVSQGGRFDVGDLVTFLDPSGGEPAIWEVISFPASQGMVKIKRLYPESTDDYITTVTEGSLKRADNMPDKREQEFDVSEKMPQELNRAQELDTMGLDPNEPSVVFNTGDRVMHSQSGRKGSVVDVDSLEAPNGQSYQFVAVLWDGAKRDNVQVYPSYDGTVQHDTSEVDIPDMLPWEEDEQDYYRTSSDGEDDAKIIREEWYRQVEEDPEEMKATDYRFKSGDRVVSVGLSNRGRKGKIFEIKHDPGGTIADVNWDDSDALSNWVRVEELMPENMSGGGIPWGEEEQEYYRTAQLQKMTAWIPVVGDKVLLRPDLVKNLGWKPKSPLWEADMLNYPEGEIVEIIDSGIHPLFRITGDKFGNDGLLVRQEQVIPLREYAEQDDKKTPEVPNVLPEHWSHWREI